MAAILHVNYHIYSFIGRGTFSVLHLNYVGDMTLQWMKVTLLRRAETYPSHGAYFACLEHLEYSKSLFKRLYV